jgi:hypothetical protein
MATQREQHKDPSNQPPPGEPGVAVDVETGRHAAPTPPILGYPEYIRLIAASTGVVVSKGSKTERVFAAEMADIAEKAGAHDHAATLRAVAKGPVGFVAGMKDLGDHRITISDVVIVVGGAGFAYLLYSGVAYWFDLPGGIFGKANSEDTAKVVDIASRRRAA